MKSVWRSLALSGALLGIALTASAKADGTSPAFPFAATASIAGGYSTLDPTSPFIRCFGGCERELALIVGGGDFVIPVTSYWNIQLGGAWYSEHEHRFFSSFTNTQFQGGGIGFWRDPMTGAFGIEAGMFSVNGDNNKLRPDSNYVKLGGVGEYYWGDMATINVFGGALLPFDEAPFGAQGPQIDTGFYTGGHLTWYTSSNFAIAAFGRYVQTNYSFGGVGSEIDANNLVVGGKVRYLTSMSGIELFASGAYRSCWTDESFRGRTFSFVEEGVEILAGVNIRLGGRDGSLVDIDRSNAMDTRPWACGGQILG